MPGLLAACATALGEPFFSSLKKERTKKQNHKNRQPALAQIPDHIRNVLESDTPSQS